MAALPPPSGRPRAVDEAPVRPVRTVRPDLAPAAPAGPVLAGRRRPLDVRRDLIAAELLAPPVALRSGGRGWS